MIDRLAGFLLILILFSAPSAFGQSTVLEHANRLALEEFPDLGQKGSVLNQHFLAAVAQKRQTNPNFFGNGEWPLLIVRSIAPPRAYLKFTVFQATKDGVLAEAHIGRVGRVTKAVDWTAPNPLDGRRRADVVVGSGVVWDTKKTMVFIAGLEGSYEKQSGQIMVYEAGDHNYSTVLGAAKRVPCFASTASLALELRE